jgi:adenosine deaminase/aminodeoxyfutalosine deaminase
MEVSTQKTVFVRETPSAFILGLPKAELHLHLEGAIEPETVIELARNHGQQLNPEDVHKLYHYTDFSGFMLCFRETTKHLQTPEDYELITYRMMQSLAAQNVKHAEVYVAVGTCLYWGRQFEQIFEGLERGRQRGERDFGVSLYWIFDAVRHFGPEAAMCVAEHAVKLKHRESVIGFGIGGDERRAAPELFREVYEFCSRHGLRLTCHAGETIGPESVWGALRVLRTERIGHGTSCWRDPSLMAHLVDTQIPVEISLTSNVRTGCVRGLEHHPLKTYCDLGLLVTLNTDDPAMFETTITREYQIAQDVFGFSDEKLKQLAMNSFKASFLPPEKKSEYLKLFALMPVAHGD